MATNIHRPTMQKTPLLYIFAGFFGGVIISRNADPMSEPQTAAVIVAMLVGGFITWRGGYRGKAEAVAVAVANATAIAQANADARAHAVAQQAVQVVLQRDGEGIPLMRGMDPALAGAFQTAIDYDEARDSEYAEDFDEGSPVRV